MTIIRIALPTYVLFVLIACVLGVLPIGAVAYVAAMNLIAYLTFWHDKRAAIKGHWRVSEHTLLTLSIMGGCMGAWLAQQQFRHKTQKKPFQVLFVLTMLAHIALLVWVVYWRRVSN